MKYKLVCFDLDGTLVDETRSIWQTLHDRFGTDLERRRKAIDRFMSKQMAYPEWVEHDVAMFKEKGATKQNIIDAIRRLKVMPGARETLLELKKNGIRIAVISGSIDTVLEVLFPDNPFDEVYINKFVYDEDGSLSRGIATAFEWEGKADGIRHIAKKENIDLKECVFIGDNQNDIQVAETAGLSIAFNSRSATLSQVCNVVIPAENKDVRAVLPYILPGYADSRMGNLKNT